MVIIPRIEYQLAAIILSKEECSKMMTRLNIILKKKGGLSENNAKLYNF